MVFRPACRANHTFNKKPFLKIHILRPVLGFSFVPSYLKTAMVIKNQSEIGWGWSILGQPLQMLMSFRYIRLPWQLHPKFSLESKDLIFKFLMSLDCMDKNNKEQVCLVLPWFAYCCHSLVGYHYIAHSNPHSPQCNFRQEFLELLI